MKLLLLALTAILLASAFAVQVRAENTLPLVAGPMVTASPNGFLACDPDAPAAGENGTGAPFSETAVFQDGNFSPRPLP